MELVHRDLARTNHWLGNTSAIIRRLHQNPFPLRRVLDIGCGHGAILREIRRELNVDVVGVDLQPPATAVCGVPIIRANGVAERLPEADAAICVLMAHHLSASDVIDLIQNVRRSCRRLIILDLVRSWVPLLLFRIFVAPFLSPINGSDGCLSIKRAFTGAEFRSLIEGALRETGATWTHHVAPFRIRQIADIYF
jgi:SAM-dependent methyltransferase